MAQPPHNPYQQNPYATPGAGAPGQGQYNHGPQGAGPQGVGPQGAAPQGPQKPHRFGVVTGVGLVFSFFLIVGGLTGLLDAAGNGDPFAGQSHTPEMRELLQPLVVSLQSARIPWLTGLLAVVNLVFGGLAAVTSYGLSKREEKARQRMTLLAPVLAVLATLGSVIGAIMGYRLFTSLKSFSEGLLSEVDQGVAGSVTGIMGVAMVGGLVVAVVWGIVRIGFWIYVSRYVRRAEVMSYMQPS